MNNNTNVRTGGMSLMDALAKSVSDLTKHPFHLHPIECPDCATVFEADDVQQMFLDKKLIGKCPKCGKECETVEEFDSAVDE